jgi:dinuclear metal center YbgI/SA1388 family protein
MRASEIANIIEDFAPLSFQESWDNSGFCIGSPSDEVHGVLIGFDCTPDLVNEAIEIGADMIITHHPLIFSPLKKISSDNSQGKAIINAIKHNIVIYASHTNMDKVINGVSGKMARRLSLKNVEIMEKGEHGEGLGVVGTLPEPMKSEEFIAFVRKSFSLKCVRVSKPTEKWISKVALCGGAGRSLIKNAVASGADVYITGDISYHDFLTDNDFMIMDIGHFESEIDIVKTIFDILKEKIPNFAVQIEKKNNNLVYYY